MRRTGVIGLDTDGDDHNPVTPASSIAPECLASPTFSAELPPLKNYIPVGCFVHPSTFVERQSYQDEWLEVSDTTQLSGRPLPFLRELQHLLAHGWVRMFTIKPAYVFRIYILPGDVGHRYIDHSSKSTSKALHAIIREIDVSPDAWNGRPKRETCAAFDPFAALDEGSLHWMFNTLPSPAPKADAIDSYFHRLALRQLLNEEKQLPGLKTRLYPYQRRSAGLMLQKESETRLELDPRLEPRTALDGSVYLYGPRNTAFLKSPRFYESSKGGILAETMGLGKTVMCVALVLSTKGYLPKVPVQFATFSKRAKVGSLAEMAIASIIRHSAPWRPFFEGIATSTGEHMTECLKLVEQYPASYDIPVAPIRWNRKTTVPLPKKLILASTTLVVVPRNLFLQWKSELEKHVKIGALNILFMDDPKQALPGPKALILYDLVLFSRPRFEQEVKDGSDDKGRRQSRYPLSCNCPYIGATRNRDCTCLRNEELYDSPLKHVHFLRIIVDEGHFFTSSRTRVAEVANSIVRADHRWVVTGTPAKDLLGVEMDITADSAALSELQRQEGLQQRKNFNLAEDMGGATRSIGDLVSHFLKVRPWTACDGERPADWRQEIYRQESHASKPVIVGFAKSLRRTLESVVIKTRPEDVERDIGLPPLEHRVALLKPSFFDKLTANTFAFVLAANAVTSERTDTDYLFHPNSRKERTALVHNLRASAFAWTGFSEEDVQATISNSEGYLKKQDVTCSEEDRELLMLCIEQAKRMVASSTWSALSKSHEVGLFVEKWPAESAQFWSFDQSQTFNPSQPLLCGVTQLLKAQAHVNERILLMDPSEGLSGAGIRHLSILRSATTSSTSLVKSGIPSSSVKEQPLHHRLSGAVDKTQPSMAQAKTRRLSAKTAVYNGSSPDKSRSGTEALEVLGQGSPGVLPCASPLRDARIIGTTSAKLSYLLSRIEDLYREEKILIFYDNDNTAYYIAQALETLHIGHFIYAKSLTAVKKSEYIVQFDKDPRYRVLLMDIGQAAFGLNVPSASRVFFLNPVCQPHIEAQAIKRAHRIGQTKKVFVETLVLEGSIEEKMFERARRMTRQEHHEAKLLDDDLGIKQIIQSVRLMHILDQERKGTNQIALLDKAQQVWSRNNWPQWKIMQDESHNAKKSKRKAEEIQENNTVPKRRKTTAESVTFIDVTDATKAENVVYAESEPGTPIQSQRRSSVEEDNMNLPSAATTQGPSQPTSIFGGSIRS